ncbi:MAG: hypothetical protein JNJ58_14130 [Chitinophagaceae bacterium]|nr:hypothetical protein [Chitinophagaceae bacterium]
MKKMIILTICLMIGTINVTRAQVTHGISFRVGINNSLYKTPLPNEKNFGSYFLPSFSIHYSKFSDNLFWGGVGLGVTPRLIPFYEYQTGQKIGASSPEFWLQVRTGFKIERSFSTHLPYLGLNISRFAAFESWTKNGQNTTIYTAPDSLFKSQAFHPSLEIGTSLLNSTFREDKRNVFIHFAVRYYPMKMFKESIPIEYEPGNFVNIQYNLMEIIISAGIQRNVHR